MVDTKIMNIWMNGVESSGIKAKSFFLQTDSGGGGGGGEGKFQCMSMG